METTNTAILKIMNVLFWIAFIGLCIKAGAILTSFVISLYVNPAAAHNLYLGLNLSDLFALNSLYYASIVSLLIVLTALKAHIAYMIVRFFMKFKLSQPFDAVLTTLFLRISHVALGTGILAIIASGYAKWIMKKGVSIPIDWGGNEILFFAGVIYLLALVFRKGTELQTEHDLTV